MDVYDIARTTRRGAQRLSEALWELWSSLEDDEMPEANLWLHVAHAFSDAGFLPFAGAPFGPEEDAERLHLLLWNPREKVLVAAQARRLDEPDACRELIADVDRMGGLDPQDLDEPEHAFGLLLVETWDEDIASWWSSLEGEPPSDDSCWTALADHPALEDAHWGSVVLQGFDEDRSDEEDFQHFLYCVFPIDV